MLTNFGSGEESVWISFEEVVVVVVLRESVDASGRRHGALFELASDDLEFPV